MIKIKAVSLVTAAMLCAGAAFAGEKGDKGCCATTASNKAACADYAKLNLTADQKTKLDALQAQCDKEGCTKESMDKFMNSAEDVLSKEQFATLKAECNKQHGQKRQS